MAVVASKSNIDRKRKGRWNRNKGWNVPYLVRIYNSSSDGQVYTSSSSSPFADAVVVEVRGGRGKVWRSGVIDTFGKISVCTLLSVHGAY